MYMYIFWLPIMCAKAQVETLSRFKKRPSVEGPKEPSRETKPAALNLGPEPLFLLLGGLRSSPCREYGI